MKKLGLSTYKIGPLTGGLNSSAEDGSLISYQNREGLGVELRAHKNWLPLRRGGLKLPDGYRQTLRLPAAVAGLHQLYRSNGVVTQLAVAGGKLYSMDGGVYRELGTGIATSDRVQITTAKDSAVVSDGVNKLWQWDGTTFSAIDNAVGAAKASLYYQNKLWYFRADAETSLLYHSDPLDITDGYADNFVACLPSNGQAITSIASYFVPATLEPIIIVTKERSVGIVTGTGTDSSPYTYMEVNQEAGVLGTEQVVQFGADVAYLTLKGVSSYKTESLSGNLTHTYLSEKIRDKFLEANLTNFSKAKAWHDWKQRRICFAVPLTGQTEPSTIYAYDTELRAWHEEEWPSGISAIMVLRDGTVVHGDSLGNVYEHAEGLGYGTTAISPSLATDYTDFGRVFNYKRIVEMRVKFRTQGTLPYTLGLNYNNGEIAGQSYRLDTLDKTRRWGQGVWSASTDDGVWGGETLREIKLYPASCFDTVQFTLSAASTESVLFDNREEFFGDAAGLFDGDTNLLIDSSNPFAQLLSYKARLANALKEVLGFIGRNRGNTKPNALNADGLPYHVFEDTSQWLISPTATTSEGLSIYVRALVWAGQTEEAKRVLGLIEAKTFFNGINLPHWLVDLVGGTPTHAIRVGNYDSAAYTATTGVFTIPNGPPHYGEAIVPPTGNLGGNAVSGIPLVCDASCEFLYKGYDLLPITGTGNVYEVASYTTTASGTVVTLTDDTVNGSVQVNYAYFDGNTLPPYGLYMSYPALLRSYDEALGIKENRIAADAALWLADAYWDLFNATSDVTYKNKFDALLAKLADDQTLNGSYVTPFNSAQRGLHFSAITTYDEATTRNVELDLVESSETRFSFGSGSGAVNWTQGQPFTWETAYPLEVRLKGDGSGSLRWVLVDDEASVRYRYPWLDSDTTDRVISFNKSACITWANQYFDASRKPFNTLFTAKDASSSLTLTTVTDYSPAFVDSSGVPYPVWNKLAYTHHGGGGYVIAGIGKPSDTGSDGTGSVLITVGGSIAQGVEVRLTDDDSVTHSYTLGVTTSPTTHSIPWASFDGGAIAHPVQTVELLMPSGVTADLYIAGFSLGNRQVLASNSIDLIGFETRQPTAGSFSIIYARTKRTQFDEYNGAGVALFSLEYNKLGLTGWRGPSYVGYQVPAPWAYHNASEAAEALRFMRDAQLDYQGKFGALGPFTPVFYRNLEENSQYGTIGTFGFSGPDPNTNWAGWQYRAISSVGEAYYAYYKITGLKDTNGQAVLDDFLTWAVAYLDEHDALPSDFRSNGDIERNYNSPDFWALVARACIGKLKVDRDDAKALQVLKLCLDKILASQQTTGAKVGAFTYNEQSVYMFHQSEIIVTLGQLLHEINLVAQGVASSDVDVFDIECVVQAGGLL